MESEAGSQSPMRSISKWSDRLPPRAVAVEMSLLQLAMMVRSGMTLLTALESVIDQTPSRGMKRVWRQVSDQLQSGKGLADAMSEHRCFPEFVLRLVKVGEQSGNLATVLTRAAQTMRDRRDSRESVVSATIYPVLILLMAAGVTAYMIIYLIPRLETYLQSLGKELPAMTESLIAGSLWLRTYYPFLIVGLTALIALIWILYSAAETRVVIDQWLLRVPVLNKLIQYGETAIFARSLSMMLKSGVTLTEGLTAIEKIVANHFLRRTIVNARENLIRGGSLADAFSQKGAFHPMLYRMAAVGQETGELHQAMDEVAEFQDAQLKSLTKRLNAILTPVLTVLIGGIVGYVYIAFFMALISAGS